MSAAQSMPVADTAAGFLHRFDGLRRRLPGDAAARDAAADLLRAKGLPTRALEAWHYTSLRPLADVAFHEPLTAVSPGADVLDGVALPDVPRLVFVDGRFQPELSSVPDGVTLTLFADRPVFGTLAHPERETLVALNTMLAEDGARLHVAAGVDGGTLCLVSIGGGVGRSAMAFHPRHAVTLEAGARLTLIEVSHGAGAYLHNPVMEVSVAEGAEMVHIRLQDEAPEAFHLSTVYADIAERGVYDSFGLNLGSRLSRNEVHARLLGPHAAAHLNGAQLLSGSQHSDFTTVVSHKAPSCASRQTVKNVLTGHSRGVFQGKIEVDRIAQKTDGYQMNQALLLSAESEIDCKPQLEIYADDVKCSHGATVGELDAEQLFYLRSRGVPLAQARSLLVRAFLAEALDPIANEGARAMLEGAVERWWSRQETAPAREVTPA
ncbi:MAG: Fe-S cluster assembly protein SufD [Janthinobacterium lividum]